MKSHILVIVLTFLILDLAAFSKLPERTQICLNGEWDFTPAGKEKQKIMVPDYWDAHKDYRGVDEAIYERTVTVPDTKDWADKQIVLEFGGVNFLADVYVNDQPVVSHTGGWISFSADITRYVKPGESYRVKVIVKGGNHEPIVDENKMPQWPVGFFGQFGKWGIVFDVWMRAYGKTGIYDAFIQTSCRNKTLKVDYTLKNTTTVPQKVKLVGRILEANDMSRTIHSFETKAIKFKAGGQIIIPVISAWSDPHLWTPGDPFLYYLETKLIDVATNKVLDREIRRFGFREIWVEGPKLMLNGQRLTILGANIVQHSEFYFDQRYYYLSPESWNRTIDRLFELNLRTVRFHMQPAPDYMLDIADERGLLIIDESTIYAREFIEKVNKRAYLENCYRWIGPWIRDRRNHPSVILWNAENEMGVGWLKWMTSEEMMSLGDTIRRYDATRPVNYDGDRDVGDQMVNLHYPETYKGTVSGSIYAWADSLHPDKPTGVGEFITHYGENGLENQWWMGTFVRGMRYVYFSDIRPYRHDWALLRSDNTECIDNLSRSLSPVALFDKAYDDLGIDPLLYKNYPILNISDTINGELILYNDEFSDIEITVEVLVKSTDTYMAIYNYNGDQTPVQRIVAEDIRTYIVPLGEHVDIPYTFIVPSFDHGLIDRIDVELIARKKGEVKFRETLHYVLRGKSFVPVESTAKIELFDAEQPDFFGR